VNQVQELEQAILSRAERLAAEYRERAKRSRDNILREAAERLRLREQREESIAKALGERTYRQQVQANELKMQSQLDQVRWNLVEDVERRLAERMQVFMIQNEADYLEMLRVQLAESARQIERDELVVEANAQDQQRLKAQWEGFVEAAAGKQIRLAADPIETLGGLLVRSEDNRIRIDNTFEGRRERLRLRIQQVILERLLPSTFEAGNLFTG
jgi:V/A-type H+-transporting ATPase subunit E